MLLIKRLIEGLFRTRDGLIAELENRLQQTRDTAAKQIADRDSLLHRVRSEIASWRAAAACAPKASKLQERR
jgi:hypothetical protein